jgi:carboxyl-terminal processing protease
LHKDACFFNFIQLQFAKELDILGLITILNFMFKKIAAYLLVSVVTVILTLSVSGEASKNSLPNLLTRSNDVNHEQLMKKIINITKKNYVEEIEEDKLYYSAYDGMLRSLDPHSGFLNPDDFKEMHVQTSGEFGGVGIEITMDQGLLKVVSPIDDTPAFKAGLQPADYITMINKESVRDLNINQAVQRIRGPKGSDVVLTIVRKGESEPLDFTLTRDTIKIASVKSKQIIDDIGYFRVTSFSKNTTINLESQYKKLASKMSTNLKGIVLDLRNNPGGLLDQAIGISELFLDGGVVVSTKGRQRNSEEVFNASSGDITKGLPIVVLINQGSASASEIVSGALQDHKRAVVMGVKSFGKGSVQTVVPLGTNLGMRITTSKYYTPSGNSIQAKGIIPDIEVEQTKIKINDNEYISEANLKGHLAEQKSKDEARTNQEKLNELYEEDYQLARAVDLLHALSVLK